MIVFLKKAFAPKGASISVLSLRCTPEKKPNFLPTIAAAAAAPTLKKSARGDLNEDT